MRCIVRTPDAELLDGEVEMAVLPGSDGEVGILAGHAPMVLALGVGACRLKTPEGTISYALSGGFTRVHKNVVTVLTTRAEAGAGIDPEEAKKALAEAKGMEGKDKEQGIIWARARLAAATHNTVQSAKIAE